MYESSLIVLDHSQFMYIQRSVNSFTNVNTMNKTSRWIQLIRHAIHRCTAINCGSHVRAAPALVSSVVNQMSAITLKRPKSEHCQLLTARHASRKANQVLARLTQEILHLQQVQFSEQKLLKDSVYPFLYTYLYYATKK